MIRPCPALRRFADAVSIDDAVELRYRDFWRELPTDEESSIRTMFRALFGGLGLRKPVVIRSVFAHHHHGGSGGGKSDGGSRGNEDGDDDDDEGAAVRVAFSGEARHLDPTRHDLNLIMAPDDPARNVVTYMNFAANAHEHGLWPLLAGRRAPGRARSFCVAVVSNHQSDVRSRFIIRLHQRRPIDSCGAWMNTVGFFAPRDEQVFGDRYLPFLGRYKFMVCFENTRCSHYLTEKIAVAYAAGCVPIYWGAPEVTRWLNPRAFLMLEDDSDRAMDALIARVLALDADQRAYGAMFAEPLLEDGAIPELMRLEVIRDKIAGTLRRSRPDAF